MRNLTLIPGIVLMTFLSVQAQVELGKVEWIRDFDDAVLEAQKTDKPILVFFQEVPGCMTCQRFGEEVMSDPFIVETIETYFVPLCIYNNREGKDGEIIKRFQEPTWNNPVLRVLDTRGQSQDRLSGRYSPRQVVDFLIEGMIKNDMVVPAYLDLYQASLLAHETGTTTAIFSTPCFWSGEGAVGEISGVISTESGWMNGKEVVKLEYNPLVIGFEGLIQSIQKKGCLGMVFTDDKEEREAVKSRLGSDKLGERGTYRYDDDTKYFVQNSRYRKLDLFDTQATRINTCLYKKQTCQQYLTPRQIEILKAP